MKLPVASVIPAILLAVLGSPTPSKSQARSSTSAEALLAGFAGTYYEGLGHYGTVLTLHRDGRFHFTTSRDHLDVPEKRAKGMVWSWNGVLILKPSSALRAEEKWETLPTRLLPVRWGQRRYLLRTDEVSIREFCNSVNLGEEPRRHFGIPYLRRGGESLPAPGLPALPVKWRAYLLQTPVTCRVTSVAETGTATIDAGSEAGLRVGMRLVAGSRHRMFRIEQVEAMRASIRAEPGREQEPVRIGEVFCTRMPER